MSEKRKALLAEKQRILKEIEYYEKRIDEARACTKKSSSSVDDSSDSETELIPLGNGRTDDHKLKRQMKMLKTCLQATQELTSLEVLQSEVNVLVDDPPLDGGSPVKEEGVWREAVVECCLDLVPFAISFYTFKANRKFAPIEYRNLKVKLLKKAHDAELSKSVLPRLTRPSDAVEVIRSYALEHRSRRMTLARLANQFGNSLLMEPIPDGGYAMKCTNMLQLSWSLQNKWSPVAPFQHRMKFDLDYMNEVYIKIITQAHRQLLEPDVDTEERTLLLAKIIRTCLEAHGPTQELHDSMSSDPETAHALHKRRTTLDQAPEVPSVKRAKKDSEVMAPPKELPKKVKKGKENVNNNKKTTKRSIEHNENEDKTKKAKTIENFKESIANNEDKTEENENCGANIPNTSKNNEPVDKTSVVSKSDDFKKKSAKNLVNERETAKKANEQQEADVNNTENTTSAKKIKKPVQNNAQTISDMPKTSNKIEKTKENIVKPNEVTSKVNEKSAKSANNIVKQVKKIESTKGSETNIQKTKTTDKITKKPQSVENVVKNTAKIVKKVVPKGTENVPKMDNMTNHNVRTNKNAARDDNTTKNNVKTNKNNEESTGTGANKNTIVTSDKNKTSKNDVAGKTVGRITKNIASTAKIVKKPVTDKILNKQTGSNVQKVKKIVSASNTNAKVTEAVNKVTKTVPGKLNVASTNKNTNVASAEKNPKTNPTLTKVPKITSNINAEKPNKPVPKTGIVSNKQKATVSNNKIITSNTKTLKDGNPGKENTQNKIQVSKIPTKKISESSSKLPVRVSPRKPLQSKVLLKPK